MDEYVMVSRAELQRLQESMDPHRGAVAWGIVCDLLERPATHQGEPVALPAMKNANSGHDAEDSYGEGWDDCLREIAKLGPLYKRPVQGEPVAWQDPDNDSRMCTAEHKAYALSKGGAPAAALSTLTRPLYSRADPGEVERLRDQLAEQDALLREIKNARDWNGSYRALEKRIDAALSASAEPSAPKCKYCGDTGQIMISRSGDANDGNAPIMEPCEDCDGPSAPVEIDERASFEANVPTPAYVYRDEKQSRYLTNCNHSACTAYQGSFEGWQARAALERKP